MEGVGASRVAILVTTAVLGKSGSRPLSVANGSHPQLRGSYTRIHKYSLIPWSCPVTTSMNLQQAHVKCDMKKACDTSLWQVKDPLGVAARHVPHHRGACGIAGCLCTAPLQGSLEKTQVGPYGRPQYHCGEERRGGGSSGSHYRYIYIYR